MRDYALPRILAAAAAILLQACATPIGKLADHDFTWDSRLVAENYQSVYRTMLGASKKCDWLVAEGNLYTDIGEGVIDIYGGSLLGGRSNFVGGTIRIKALSPENTRVEVGVTDIGSRHLKLFIGWVDGVSGC